MSFLVVFSVILSVLLFQWDAGLQATRHIMGVDTVLAATPQRETGLIRLIIGGDPTLPTTDDTGPVLVLGLHTVGTADHL